MQISVKKLENIATVLVFENYNNNTKYYDFWEISNESILKFRHQKPLGRKLDNDNIGPVSEQLQLANAWPRGVDACR